jgi:hypothetical protein
VRHKSGISKEYKFGDEGDDQLIEGVVLQACGGALSRSKYTREEGCQGTHVSTESSKIVIGYNMVSCRFAS